MVTLGEFDFFTFEELLKNKTYNLLCIDYDRPDGISYIKDIGLLSDEDKRNFYKMIIFNDHTMIEVYNDGDTLTFNQIDKEDFSRSEIKKFYTDTYGKMLVRVGEIEINNPDANNDDEPKTIIIDAFQYVGFEEGDI